MKITVIKYEQVRNLGNYESARCALEAQVVEGENLRQAYYELRETAIDMLYDRRPAPVKESDGTTEQEYNVVDDHQDDLL